jgi:hypothetical protein
MEPHRFAWWGKDEATHNHCSHQRESDDKVTAGLPDGRSPVVTYRANGKGYVTRVKNEGEANYPEFKLLSSSYTNYGTEFFQERETKTT